MIFNLLESLNFFTNEPYVLTRQIAKEAREAGFEAIIAPSATGTGVILAIFSDCLDPRSRVEIVNP